MMSIFIGGAWPYANGSLHLGHISSLLPGDILARYYRAKGENVLYLSGSDCNGTPISIRAKQEGKSAKEIADYYHAEFRENFNQLGFTYDFYTRTDEPFHHQVVQEIFLSLLDAGRIYKKKVEQAFCLSCNQFLPDRYVEGKCPHCGNAARGDQCDECSTILDPLELIDKACRNCGDTPITKETDHFYFELSAFQSQLESYVRNAKEQLLWRDNAIKLSERYLNDGLRDRAVSRDLPIGVTLPVKGYEDKKIYVWIEAVSGYYSASKQWEKLNGGNASDFWDEGSTSFYVHGKDNIPFHSIIWPSILLGTGIQPLPTHIVSNEYLTVEKRKLSTSKNWAVWVPEILKDYDPDSIRYFLTINAPEERDCDFSWREFIYSHNSELLGAYGNFVNRTLKFIEKYLDGEIPSGKVDTQIKKEIPALFEKAASLIEQTQLKKALEEIFAFIRQANQYFDKKQPWIQVKESPADCKDTMRTCVYLIANFAVLLEPFLPFSSGKVKKMLGLNHFRWVETAIDNLQLFTVSPLFERIDIGKIKEEIERLENRSN